MEHERAVLRSCHAPQPLRNPRESWTSRPGHRKPFISSVNCNDVDLRRRGRRRRVARRSSGMFRARHHCARVLDAHVHRFGHPIAREVEQVVNRHFGLDQVQLDVPAELAGTVRPRFRRCSSRAASRYAKKLVSATVSMIWKYCATKPSRHSLRAAHRPDRPDLVGAPPHRLFEVGVADVHGVEVGVAVDLRPAETTSAATRPR